MSVLQPLRGPFFSSLSTPPTYFFSTRLIIDGRLFNHQLIYCTRKFSCTKVGTHKQITFRSLKNYTAETYKKALSKVYFPNYENFGDANKAYENFIPKLMIVIDKLVPCKTKQVKDKVKTLLQLDSNPQPLSS